MMNINILEDDEKFNGVQFCETTASTEDGGLIITI